MGSDELNAPPRRWPALLAALAAAIALAFPAGAGAKVSSQFFGMSAVGPSEGDFTRMGDAGLGTYRFGLSWRNAQPTRKGGYRWTETDANVRRAASNGMRPLPFAFGTPRYVHKPVTELTPPRSKEDLRLWRRFLAAAAKRYGPGGDFWLENPTVPSRPIREWIVWNEQNALPFWHPRPDPRVYAKLVKASERAISSVDPSARIVLGGMFGSPGDRRSISARGFLRRLYRVKGIERHFEAINVHPYGAGVGAVRKQLKQARRAVAKAGDRGVDTYVGEIGWASAGPKGSAPVVGRKGQARRIRAGLKLLVKKRRRWNITGAAVYVWRDFTADTACRWCPKAGMLSVKGNEKPAARALRRVIASQTR